jgi:hypothetical protein
MSVSQTFVSLSLSHYLSLSLSDSHLYQNANGILPLKMGQFSSIAVIGDDAGINPIATGGGSVRSI